MPGNITCAKTAPNSRELLSGRHPYSIACVAVGTTIEVFLIVLFAYEVYRKCKQNLLHEQRVIIFWLLGLYPVIGFTCLVSIWAPLTAFVTDLFNTVYFSICLLKFFNLIVIYFGGEDNMLNILCDKEMPLASPPLCCCRCLPHVRVSKTTIVNIRRLILQFVFVPSILVYIAAIFMKDNPNDSNINIVVQALRSISTMAAFYGIVLLLRAVHVILTHHHIKKKFVGMKLALLFSHVQLFILNTMSYFNFMSCDQYWSREYRVYYINNNLVVIEMLLVSIFAIWCYWNESSSEIFELMPIKDGDSQIQRPIDFDNDSSG